MTEPLVSRVDAGTRMVSRRITVAAPASDVFDLVANPHRHAELDGSGTVRQAPVTAPERLSEGARFRVAMKMHGVPYGITSTVTGYQENRLVEWQHPFGHRWRWELVEVSPGITEVTETFDYTTSRAPRLLELLRMPAMNAHGITRTLRQLAERFTEAGPGVV